MITHTYNSNDILLLLQVRCTLLNIGNERTWEKLKTSDGRGPVHYERLVDSPRFYYRKQMNYLKREEREELLKIVCFVLLWCKINFRNWSALEYYFFYFLRMVKEIPDSIFYLQQLLIYGVKIKMITCASLFCANVFPEPYFCLHEQRKHLLLENIFFIIFVT